MNKARRGQYREEALGGLRAGSPISEKQGFFKVIGRLLPSTVYDGERLPKLYRIVSPEPGAARTLAYIMPQPGLDLDAKLGRIVGVAGDSKMDDPSRPTLSRRNAWKCSRSRRMVRAARSSVLDVNSKSHIADLKLTPQVP